MGDLSYWVLSRFVTIFGVFLVGMQLKARFSWDLIGNLGNLINSFFVVVLLPILTLLA